MIGSDLVRNLSNNFLITPVTKSNYHNHIGKKFDIVINANGNSKRYWANQNILDDFTKSTISVYKSILDFPCNLYIYLSSSDVYPNHTKPKYTKETEKIDTKHLQTYGFHKYLSELIVKRWTKKYLILRLSMVLGTKLKKGPFYDITHNTALFVKLNTKLQLITTRAIAKIIEALIKSSEINSTINIGGIGTFAFSKINKYFNHEVKVSLKAETQIYEMDVNKLLKLYPSLKTSENYLKEYLS